MPVYEFLCEAGHRFDRVLKVANYDAPQTCDCGVPAERQICAPMFIVDIPAYQSPIDGRTISSRAQRREDLARNECVEYEPSMKEHAEKRRAAEDAALETKMEQTIEAEIHAMPARKREKLVAELQSGVDVQYARV